MYRQILVKTLHKLQVNNFVNLKSNFSLYPTIYTDSCTAWLAHQHMPNPTPPDIGPPALHDTAALYMKVDSLHVNSPPEWYRVSYVNTSPAFQCVILFLQ